MEHGNQVFLTKRRFFHFGRSCHIIRRKRNINDREFGVCSSHGNSRKVLSIKICIRSTLTLIVVKEFWIATQRWQGKCDYNRTEDGSTKRRFKKDPPHHRHRRRRQTEGRSRKVHEYANCVSSHVRPSILLRSLIDMCLSTSSSNICIRALASEPSRRKDRTPQTCADSTWEKNACSPLIQSSHLTNTMPLLMLFVSSSSWIFWLDSYW